MTMHPSHHHELHELEELQIKDGVYKCNLCKMPGHGKRYRCRSCDFDVHKFCMDPERKISPEAFPKLADSSSTNFFLLYHPPPLPPPQTNSQCRQGRNGCGRRRSCYVCGKAVEGLVYYRLETDCVVHPLCSQLKEIRQHVDGDGDGDVIFDLCDGGKGLKCEWCKEAKLKASGRTIPGMYYVSRVKDQGTFHVFCLLEMMNNTCSTSSAGSSSDHYHKNQLVKASNSKGMVMKRTTSYGLGRTSTWLKMVKALLKIVLSVLLGDPTTLISALAVELFIK